MGLLSRFREGGVRLEVVWQRVRWEAGVEGLDEGGCDPGNWIAEGGAAFGRQDGLTRDVGGFASFGLRDGVLVPVFAFGARNLGDGRCGEGSVGKEGGGGSYDIVSIC
jgi:hypothetical protein